MAVRGGTIEFGMARHGYGGVGGDDRRIMTGRGNRRIIIRVAGCGTIEFGMARHGYGGEDGDGRTNWQWIECSAASPGRLYSPWVYSLQNRIVCACVSRTAGQHSQAGS